MTQETSKKNIKATNKSLQADIKSEGSGSFRYLFWVFLVNAQHISEKSLPCSGSLQLSPVEFLKSSFWATHLDRQSRTPSPENLPKQSARTHIHALALQEHMHIHHMQKQTCRICRGCISRVQVPSSCWATLHWVRFSMQTASQHVTTPMELLAKHLGILRANLILISFLESKEWCQVRRKHWPHFFKELNLQGISKWESVFAADGE